MNPENGRADIIGGTRPMKTYLLRFLVAISLPAFVACTTMQEVKPQDGVLADYLEIGDHIIVYEKSGRIVDMRFVLVDEDVLRGSLFVDGLEPVEIDIDQIERIEAERIAAGRTTAAVLGGIVVAPIAALGAGMAIADY